MRRATFVRGSVGWAAAGLAGAAGLTGSAGTASAAPSPAGDRRILNFLLLLEFVQEALYTRAARTRNITGELQTLAAEAADNERHHVRRLMGALGSRARARPTTHLDEALRSPGAFLAAALSVEETATAAYIGQAANLTKNGIEVIAPIVSVDARHAAWIRSIVDRIPAPRAADPTKTPEQALEVLKRMKIVDVR